MSVDGPPLTPDAETARRWAEEELAKSEYTQGGESWLDRAITWFVRLIEGVGDGVGNTLGPLGTIVAILVGAGLVALIVWIVVGPLRRSRRVAVEDGLFEDDRGADELASTARAAAKAGDWETATLDLFRSLMRRLAERDLITLVPALTAQEAAAEATAALPMLGGRLHLDADAFDGIRYGHVGATQETYAHVEETMRLAARARREVSAG